MNVTDTTMHGKQRPGRNWTRRLSLGLIALLAACGGGGGGGGDDFGATCDFTISSQPQALSTAEVEQLLARAAEASRKLGRDATIAVSDRVGNVLGVYQMGGPGTVTIRSGRAISGGLEEAAVPRELAAVAKAITGAYLSSSGNAFSTRSASFIVQEHFVPGIKDQQNKPLNTASGPLFGVQFSQLPCGDFVKRGGDVGVGPKRSPLGLAADAGGFPLYKNGRVVGGIGVVADGIYGLDLDPTDFDNDVDERIAQSALGNFAAPSCIRADKISLLGPTVAYSDSDQKLVSVSATSLIDPALVGSGSLIAVAGYIDSGVVRAGTAFGAPSSGVVPAQGGSLQARNAYVLVDAGNPLNRFPASSSVITNNLTAAEVTALLDQALGVANQTRAQIRRPASSAAQVSISVVDTDGVLLGLARTPDAPVFGADVSLQKARTAAFFSSSSSAAALSANAQAQPYLTRAQTFFGSSDIFADDTAFSAKAISNIARPFYPDGIEGRPAGPFSQPINSWSAFNVGLQLDVVLPAFLAALDPTEANMNCTGSGAGSIAALKNGMQIFSGAVPIYRDGVVVGAIGVSGDGVDQDDMIAALGLKRASQSLAGAISHAAPAMRADQLAPQGFALRYVQCPVAPFINSNEQNVCSAL